MADSPNAPLKISVVTIVLNRKAFLQKAIDSVLAQNYPNVEHIVVDGGSSDGTVELLKSYSHLKWISEPDDGQADAMNKGIAMMTGDVFAWLNSDDTYPDGTFDTVNRYFSEDRDLDMIYGTCRLTNNLDEEIGRTRYHPFDLNRLRLGYNNINTPAAFVRTSALAKAGPMDVSLRATYDVDMWIRIGMNGKVQAVPETLSNLCLHDGSGLVSTRHHIGETGLLRRKYAQGLSLYQKLVRAPYFKMRHAAYDMIRFNQLLKRI